MEIIKEPTQTKAKKEHTCDFCYGKIRVEENYLNSTLKIDDIYSFKVHLNCDYISKELNMYRTANDCGEEGLTGEFFQETICIEYISLISNKIEPFTSSVPKDISSIIFSELSKVKFNEKLNYVIRHHKVLNKN